MKSIVEIKILIRQAIMERISEFHLLLDTSLKRKGKKKIISSNIVFSKCDIDGSLISQLE
jgi:hypothetical protein